MNKELFNEGNLGREAKENEPTPREIDIYFLRHGQATGEAPDAGLTELGQQQAQEAAESLLQKIQISGGVVKFLSSRTRRADQTMEIMQKYVKSAMAERRITNIRLFSARPRNALTAVGIISDLRNLGIKDPVEHWLTHPDILEGKSPAEISAKIEHMLGIIQGVADRLPPGEKIHYIAVTHEVPEAALINSATGKTLNELGGSIKNCEFFQVQIEGKSTKKPTIQFRDVQAELNIKRGDHEI